MAGKYKITPKFILTESEIPIQRKWIKSFPFRVFKRKEDQGQSYFPPVYKNRYQRNELFPY